VQVSRPNVITARSVDFVEFDFCVCCDVARSKDVVQPVKTSVPFQDSLPNCWCRVVGLRHKFFQMVVGTNTLEVVIAERKVLSCEC
jgi:hypothetical protein